ncbi:ABC transporter substrate-binding protein [Massilia putida]|uniref:ABC transporter substrate-binding protein n=1 Tax=Massilia putida TaxID=1141883 RepID=UPI0009531541|nr:ABC transporter substrate-binding protein [Massilia putida]
MTDVPSLPHSATRRELLRALLAGGIAAGGGLLAPGALAQPDVPRRGGRLTVATQSSSTADTLDPVKGALSTDYVRTHLFYSCLTSLDARLVPQPALAEECATDDATVWHIRLRKDVLFHDGKPLDAADVVYSLNRHNDPRSGSKAKALAEQFDTVRATGPLDVELRLKSANADLPVLLATAPFAIVQDGTTRFDTAIGTGPFRCQEFRPGVRTLAVRNPGYWRNGLPYLDEVVLFGIPDEPARLNALLSGDVDWINELNPRSTKRVRAAPGFNLLEAQSGLYTDLIVRQTVGAGRHPDFTLAMKYLIDREQIRRAVFRGYAVIGNDQPLAPNHRFYFAGLPQRPHDPERARYHLRKAGMLGTTVPVVASPAATGSVDMAMLMQQSAREAGLKLVIKRVSADGYWSNHWMKSPIGFGNINPRASADMLFTQFFQSNGPWNESGWQCPQFDQLLVQARGETDSERRKQMYADMQVLVHDKCGVAIPVFITNLEACSSRVRGIAPHPLGAFMGYAFGDHAWLAA